MIHLLMLPLTMKGEGRTWKDCEVSVIGVHSVNFPNNQ